MTELNIVAAVEVKADFGKEILNAFHRVVDETRKEEGCISYTLFQDIKNPLKFTILEVWKSQEAIDEHNQTAHFKAFVGELDGKIDSITVDVIKKVY